VSRSGTRLVVGALVLTVWLGAPPPARAEDDWLGADKALHFGVSAGCALIGYGLSAPVWSERWQRATAGASFALSLGAAKELYDLAGHGDASWRDFAWDAIGAASGVLVALGIDLLVELIAGEEAQPP